MPQLTVVASPRPRNSRAESVKMAPMMAKMRLETVRLIMFGMISAKMMRGVDSPLMRAACTKSRLRSERVWLRKTRPPQAQPVTEITTMIAAVP